jgi:CarD family transcriptional regulator
MFNIGDKIVYPMHGAGIIEKIEENEVLGERQKFYVMRLPLGDMKVMIPMNSMEELGLRQVISSEEVDNAINVLKGEVTKMSSNWNRRYRANMGKLKTGDIYEVAEVVRNLSIRDKKKGLSTGERRMLDNAKQILVSELVLAKDMTEDQVLNLIDTALTVE